MGFRCQYSIAGRTFPAVGSVAVICELSLVGTLFHRDDPGQRSCGIKDMFCNEVIVFIIESNVRSKLF